MPLTRLWHRLLIYLFALTIALLTVYVRRDIAIPFTERQLLILFVFPISLSALIGGGGPGVTATLAAVLGLKYWVMPTLGNWSIESANDRLSLGFLLVAGFAISALGELMHRSQQGAEKSHRLLQALVSGAPDPVFIKDQRGKYLLVNDSAARFVLKSPDEIIGQDDRSLFLDEIAVDLMRQDQEIMRTGQVQAGERIYTSIQGRKFALSMTKGPIFDSSGRAMGVFGIGRDISERKRMEDALRQSAEHMSMAMGAAPMGTWAWNVDKDEIYWSENLWAMFGLSVQPGPLDSRVFRNALHPDDRDLVLEAIQAAVERDAPYKLEFRIVKPDGTVRWALSHGRVIRDQAGHAVKMVGVDLDITERKTLEEALCVHREQLEQLVTDRTAQLEQRERDLRTLLDHMPALIANWDRNLHNRFANNAYEEWFGFDSSRLPGMFLPEVIGDALYAVNRPRIEAVLSGERQDFEVAAPPTKTRESRQLSAHYIPEVLNGEVTGFYVLATDITTLKQTEKALRASEERLRAIFSALPTGLAIIDGEGRIIDCNPASERLLGLSKQEQMSRALDDSNLWNAMRPDDAALPVEEYPVWRALRKRTEIRDAEIKFVQPNGNTIRLSVNAIPISDPHQGVVLAYEDITQRKHMEEQKHLMQERMEGHLTQQVAMQTIAALAHQFNQPLTAIRFYLETALGMVNSNALNSATLETLLTNSIKDIERAGEVLREMVQLVYKPAEEGEIANLNELLKQAFSEFKAHSRSGYRLTTEPCSPDVKVKMHIQQTHKILENLLRNSEEAMLTAGVPPAEGNIILRAEVVDGTARITVQDNGPGIPHALRNQTFTPFFTTKENGLGLGLAISRSLAETQGGALWFENLPQGICFCLALPLGDAS